MPKITPDIETGARIKVVGVGGSGKNATNHMVSSQVKGVEFIAINTDAQDLHHSLSKKKIHIGKNLTRGLGTGMNPDLGKRAAEETKEEIQEALKGSDMVFITGGMGGGTGTGASPVVARTAKETGALTIAVVTRPFSFEGTQRAKLAELGIDELRKEVDAIIIIPNDRLLSIAQKGTTAKAAFALCNDVLRQAVEGISDLIVTPGEINADFADIRAVLENGGSALIGIGNADGEKRAEEAAKMAINSPLLDISINGARGILIALSSGEDLGILEIQEAVKIITESVDPNAKIKFGTIVDKKLKKNEIKVTVIASGFPEPGSARESLFQLRNRERTEEPTKKGSIFSPLVKEEKVEEKEEKNEKDKKKTETKPEPKPLPPSDEDDDWGAVPAFLRRSKMK